MDSLDIVTWIVAALACIFLLTGIVLITLILIGYYRRHYQPVLDHSTDEKRNEGTYSKLHFESEKKESNGYPDQAVLELRQSIQQHYTRRSRSLLEISDSRKKLVVDEFELSSLLPKKNQPVEDVMESQYFDAQESLEDSDNDYEDMEEDRFDEKEEFEKGRSKRTKRPVRSYTKAEKKRINAMKVLLLQQKRIEADFFRDIFNLETEYDEKKSNMYENRRELIELKSSHENESNDENQSADEGIPGFWLQVLLNSRNLKHIIQATDIPALEHLMDISVQNLPDQNGFRISFAFKANEYFKNLNLTKDYFFNFQPPEDASFINYEGPNIISCTGCKVQWNRHKNLTVRPVKKVQNHRIVTKFARKNSFFNFFHPPSLPSVDDPTFQKKRDLLEAHIQIGLFLKEYVIPKAFLFYTVPDFDRDIEKGGARIKKYTKTSRPTTPRKHSGNLEPEAWKLSTSKIETPSARKLSMSNQGSRTRLYSRRSEEPASDRISESQHSENSVSIDNLRNSGSNRDISSRKSAEFIAEGRTEMQNGHATSLNGHAIKEEKTEPVIDPLLGQYRMESSEKFDDFMKALGVGLVRRKLAASVIPVNVIEIEDDVYTIRTLTNVRNTEISFRLGEPFVEDTLDGRKANTTATREGNLLTLQQRGNPGEKDTVMTREVEGDTMKMELIVENVVCSRIYKRIYE